MRCRKLHSHNQPHNLCLINRDLTQVNRKPAQKSTKVIPKDSPTRSWRTHQRSICISLDPIASRWLPKNRNYLLVTTKARRHKETIQQYSISRKTTTFGNIATKGHRRSNPGFSCVKCNHFTTKTKIIAYHPNSVNLIATTHTSRTYELQWVGIQCNKEAMEDISIIQFIFICNQCQRWREKAQSRNEFKEVLSEAKQKTQIETIKQPRERRFSSVGNLRCMRRQKIKEWDGGMQGRQIT